ncbi:nucleotidyltransferase family protein, partial [Paenibacillus sp. TAF58]
MKGIKMENDFRSDSMLFSNELTLLLSIMRMDKEESMLWKDQGIENEIDWGAFLQLARHHRVFSLLYTNLRKTDSDWVPPYVMNTLQMDYQENTFNMLRLSAEMEQTCKLFSDSDISTIVLKGPVLAVDLYGDVSLRTSRDLDILIPIENVDQAEELLRSQGYVKEEEYNTILNDWKWRHHHVTFIHPDKRVTLEIHWRLSPGPGKEPSFGELWGRKRKSTITSHPVYYLGREDLFLFLASHGARHGWSRLRWLADIDRITRQDIDDAKLHSLLMKNRQLHLGAQAIILAAQLLHTPLTAEMKSITAGKRA